MAESRGDAVTSSFPTQADMTDEITSAGSSYAQLYDSDPKVEVRVNKDAAAITQKLLPEVIDGTLVLDDIDVGGGWLPNILAGLFQQCHVIPPSDQWDLTMKNIRITPALDSNDVTLQFKSGKEIDADLDLDDFRMTFELEFLSVADRTAFWCNNLGSDYRASTTVTIDGLTGSFTAKLDVPTSGSVKVASIEDLEVLPGNVTLGSDFLTAVAPYGLALYDLFGSGCGATLNACVDKLAKEQLKGSSEWKSELKRAINDSLGPIAKVDGAVNLGSARVDYAVALTSITTSDSKNRLRTQWDVDFSTNRANGSCAAGLSRSSYLTPLNTETTNDFDVLIPYRKITDLLYTIGKTGDLCAPFTWSGFATEIRPMGSFEISPSILNYFKLSLPVQVTVTAAGASGVITSTLEITAQLLPTCNGVLLNVTAVKFANATGTIRVTVGGSVTVLSATSFINSHKAAAEAAVLAALQPAYNLAPGTFAIPGTGYGLQYGGVWWGSNEVTFGVDVVAGSCN